MSDVSKVYLAKDSTEADVGSCYWPTTKFKLCLQDTISIDRLNQLLPAFHRLRLFGQKTADAQQARSFITDWERRKSRPGSPSTDPRGWVCRGCETEIESGFSICGNSQNSTAAG